MSAQYEAAAREAADKPATFGLCGQRFETKVDVDGLVIMELAKAGADQESADEDDTSAGMATLAAFYEFLEGVLPPGEWKRFRRTVRRHGVDLDQVITIARDLMPLLFGFPHTPSSVSAASPDGTGRTSTDGVATMAPLRSTA